MVKNKSQEKKKLVIDLDGEMVETNYKEINPKEYPLWYKQLFSLDEKKRKQTVSKIMDTIKESKPEAYEFIKRMNCKLVGVQPKIEYSLVSSNEGELNCTWIHGFSMVTLLFWCEEGQFGFFINPILNYDDSVLNSIDGNKRQFIKGFTG